MSKPLKPAYQALLRDVRELQVDWAQAGPVQLVEAVAALQEFSDEHLVSKVTSYIEHSYLTRSLVEIEESVASTPTGEIAVHRYPVRLVDIFDTAYAAARLATSWKRFAPRGATPVFVARGTAYLYLAMELVGVPRCNLLDINYATFSDFAGTGSAGCTKLRAEIRSHIDHWDAQDTPFVEIAAKMVVTLDAITQLRGPILDPSRLDLSCYSPDETVFAFDDHGSSIYLLLLQWLLDKQGTRVEAYQFGRNPFDTHPRTVRPTVDDCLRRICPADYFASRVRGAFKTTAAVLQPHPVTATGHPNAKPERLLATLLVATIIHYSTLLLREPI